MIGAVWDAAIRRRQELLPRAWAEGEPIRCFDGNWEGALGVVVERLGPVFHVVTPDAEEAWPSFLAERHPERVIVHRQRGVDGASVRGELPGPTPDDPLGDRPGRIVIVEEGLRFGIDLLHGRNPGLFLDARPVRQWIRGACGGQRILNLFAYTGSLGVAARAGGAKSVEHVDVVPSALARARANHTMNGQGISGRDLIQADAFAQLRQAARAGRRWDMVILDPPPVSTEGFRAGGRGRERGFDPSSDWPELLGLARRCTKDGGRILVMSASLEVEAVLPSAVEATIQRGPDFPGPPAAGLRAWVLRAEVG